MNAVTATYTVICRFHSGIDACDPWSELAVVINGIDDPLGAATAACGYLVRENGGKAEASMVISGAPMLHIPKDELFDSEYGQPESMIAGRVISYRELN